MENEIKEESTSINKVEEKEEEKASSEKENSIKEEIKKENENEIKENNSQNKENSENNVTEENNNINQENMNNTKKTEIKDEGIDPHLIFQKELLNIIQKQEKILTSTSTINEKFGISNEITKEQISSFKVNIDKYGKYLLMIKKELGMISDTMKKIKKLAKEKDSQIKK